jgi:hypothetical protein
MNMDILLVDDGGVTAVFAHNARAKEVAAGIGQMLDLIIDWSSNSKMPRGVVAVGAVALCLDHCAEFVRNLSDAGLVVRQVPRLPLGEPDDRE